MKKILVILILLLSTIIFIDVFWYNLTDKDKIIVNNAYSKISKIIEIKNSTKYSKTAFIKVLLKLRDTKYLNNERLFAIITRTVEQLSWIDNSNTSISVDKVQTEYLTSDSNLNNMTPVFLNTWTSINQILNNVSKNDYFVVSIFLDGVWTGDDGSTKIAEMDIIRSQLMRISPNIKVSWALTNNFVFHEYNRPQLKYVIEMVDKYWDEISIGSGFPNNQYDLKKWSYMMEEWIYRYRYNTFSELHVNWTLTDPAWVWKTIPAKYRPTSVTTYAINGEQAKRVHDVFWITAFMWWTATQYNVDQLSWEGSPLMPYWSHINNPMIPAQDDTTNSREIFINTITIDPIGSRYSSWQSRWTIHPADPLTTFRDGKTQLHTVKQYLNNPYHDQNTINYLSFFIDINWILRNPDLKKSWNNIIAWWPTNKNINIVWIREFADIFAQAAWNNNDKIRFVLLFRWSWETVKNYYSSPQDTLYLWIESKKERIVLSKTDAGNIRTIIDFTDYTKVIPKLKYTTNGNEEDISYVTWRNYKLTPTALLTAGEIESVKVKIKELNLNELVDYWNWFVNTR